MRSEAHRLLLRVENPKLDQLLKLPENLRLPQLLLQVESLNWGRQNLQAKSSNLPAMQPTRALSRTEQLAAARAARDAQKASVASAGTLAGAPLGRRRTETEKTGSTKDQPAKTGTGQTAARQPGAGQPTAARPSAARASAAETPKKLTPEERAKNQDIKAIAEFVLIKDLDYGSALIEDAEKIEAGKDKHTRTSLRDSIGSALHAREKAPQVTITYGHLREDLIRAVARTIEEKNRKAERAAKGEEGLRRSPQSLQPPLQEFAQHVRDKQRQIGERRSESKGAEHWKQSGGATIGSQTLRQTLHDGDHGRWTRGMPGLEYEPFVVGRDTVEDGFERVLDQVSREGAQANYSGFERVRALLLEESDALAKMPPKEAATRVIGVVALQIAETRRFPHDDRKRFPDAYQKIDEKKELYLDLRDGLNHALEVVPDAVIDECGLYADAVLDDPEATLNSIRDLMDSLNTQFGTKEGAASIKVRLASSQSLLADLQIPEPSEEEPTEEPPARRETRPAASQTRPAAPASGAPQIEARTTVTRQRLNIGVENQGNGQSEIQRPPKEVKEIGIQENGGELGGCLKFTFADGTDSGYEKTCPRTSKGCAECCRSGKR